MADDAFLETLRGTWRRGETFRLLSAEATARHRRWRRRTIVCGAIGLVVLAGCFLGFAWAAVAGRDPLLGVAALAYAVALPAVLASLELVWRTDAGAPERSPLNVIEMRRAQAQLSRRLNASGRWSARILAAAVLAVWALVALQAAGVADAVLLTLPWGGTALLVWLWSARRDAALARAVAECDRLLSEFAASDA